MKKKSKASETARKLAEGLNRHVKEKYKITSKHEVEIKCLNDQSQEPTLKLSFVNEGSDKYCSIVPFGNKLTSQYKLDEIGLEKLIKALSIIQGE